MDDDEHLRHSVARMLTVAGHQAMVSPNGVDGVRAARESPPDLVIVDLFMPEKDGLESIAELKRCLPRVPIIATSGAAFDGLNLLHVARVLGATIELRKPFDAQALLSSVSAALGTR